jgi:hypothetical protein
VHRADDGLEAVREDRLLLPPARLLFALAEPQLGTEVDLPCDGAPRSISRAMAPSAGALTTDARTLASWPSATSG